MYFIILLSIAAYCELAYYQRIAKTLAELIFTCKRDEIATVL